MFPASSGQVSTAPSGSGERIAQSHSCTGRIYGRPLAGVFGARDS